MYLTDFIFDGVKLSSLGYLVGAAVTSNNDSASVGSKLELQTVVNHGNHLTGIINATYNETITASFDIIKFACNENASVNMEDNEIASMVRWLNRSTWKKFQPIYNDLSFPNVFYMGTFTEISTINMGGCVVGLSLTFTANAPWGFLDFNYNDLITIPEGGTAVFYDQSDEIGNHYPTKITITTLKAGDLELTNDMTGKTTKIRNCAENEVIVLDCVNKIITSDARMTPLVPVMTSNTCEAGEAIYIGNSTNYQNLYKVFNGNQTDTSTPNQNIRYTGFLNELIGFHFYNPVRCFKTHFEWAYNWSGGASSWIEIKLQGSNDGENWVDLSRYYTVDQTSNNRIINIESNDNIMEYEYLGIRYGNYSLPNNTGMPTANEIQFYGSVSNIHPHLYNDFNYVYPMLGNTETDTQNVFTSTLPCTIKLDYKPIRKVGIIA